MVELLYSIRQKKTTLYSATLTIGRIVTIMLENPWGVSTMSNENKNYNGRAKILTKLFRYLFLLSIAIAVASFMIGDVFAQFLPNLYVPGAILNIACSFGYSLVLLRMDSVDKQYRTAGYCMLIASAVSLLSIDTSENASSFVLLISVATSFVQFIGQYNEMTAHDTLMIETDFNLSEKWTFLRKCYMISFLTYCVSLLLLMVISSVGVVITIVSSLAMTVISAVKVYFLYRSWKIFEAQS